jgi:hypothetical protein
MAMGHINVYRRILIWGIGTIMAIVGAVRTFAFPTADMANFPIYISLFVGGMAIIVINEVVFGLRKEQLEIDRDEKIKNTNGKSFSSPLLAICPHCKNRIPSDSKYCLQCGTDLKPQTP